MCLIRCWLHTYRRYFPCYHALKTLPAVRYVHLNYQLLIRVIFGSGFGFLIREHIFDPETLPIGTRAPTPTFFSHANKLSRKKTEPWILTEKFKLNDISNSVGDPDDFGPPGSRSICQEVWIRIRLWILPFAQKGVERTEIMLANKTLCWADWIHKFLQKK